MALREQGRRDRLRPGPVLRGRHQPDRACSAATPPCFGTFLAETRSSQPDRRPAQGLRGRQTSTPAFRRTSRPRSSRTARTSAASTRASPSSTWPRQWHQRRGRGHGRLLRLRPRRTPGPDCSSGGTQVGSDIKIIDGESRPRPIRSRRPPRSAEYCFRAEYTPAAGSSTSRASTPTAPPSASGSSRPTSRSSRRRTAARSTPVTDISFTLSWAQRG